MTDHPYKSLPSAAFWRGAVGDVAASDLDPVIATRFTISKHDKVATAGSCFAQHISRRLAAAEFTYLVAETPHPLIPAELAKEMNFGTFSARYGNVYTARQLVQLFDRAYGLFFSTEPIWQRRDGRYVDPFRPQIFDDGYLTVSEALADREFHLTRVRSMFEQLDVFVFTLGLTETWISLEDGAVFPVCPGVAGGSFDPDLYQFVNFKVHDVVQDIANFLCKLQMANPRARVVLTVSPVPLVATATSGHVLVATTYSKSVLRAACEEIVGDYAHVDYFPSYEMITGQYHRGRYFAADLRSVTEEGVSHVMRVFLKHYAGITGDAKPTAPPPAPAPTSQADAFDEMARAAEVVCDEEVLAEFQPA